MNYSNTQKWILIGVVTLGILALNTFWLFSPIFKEVSSKKATFNNNEATLNDLLGKASKKQEIEKEKKFSKYQLVDFCNKLPNVLTPEKFVVDLKNIAVRNKVQIDKLTFTNAEAYAPEGVAKDYDTVSVVAKAADKVISGFFSSNDIQGLRATDNELQYSNIPDETPIKVDVKFEFAGSFQQIKSMINEIENSEYRNIISDIAIGTKAEGDKISKGDITGKMTLGIYGFKDSKIPVYDLWTQQFERGKDNVFTLGGGKVTNVNSVTAADFNVILNPVTSDAPSIIVNKTGVPGTAVYGDNKGIEEVELYVTEKDGKYSYKYKTQSVSYPTNYVATSFDPKTENDIVIHVFSKDRVSGADNSGINLTVYNQTKRKITVIPYSDDKARPRLNNVTIK